MDNCVGVQSPVETVYTPDSTPGLFRSIVEAVVAVPVSIFYWMFGPSPLEVQLLDEQMELYGRIADALHEWEAEMAKEKERETAGTQNIAPMANWRLLKDWFRPYVKL
jgi:hypothetical protein